MRLPPGISLKASAQENEVLNLYNHKNVHDYSYTGDYSPRVTTYQFPLLSSLGFKVNF